MKTETFKSIYFTYFRSIKSHGIIFCENSTDKQFFNCMTFNCILIMGHDTFNSLFAKLTMYEDDNISIETCWVIDGNISVKLVG
jgi:dihydrofolate reductase